MYLHIGLKKLLSTDCISIYPGMYSKNPLIQRAITQNAHSELLCSVRLEIGHLRIRVSIIYSKSGQNTEGVALIYVGWC